MNTNTLSPAEFIALSGELNYKLNGRETHAQMFLDIFQRDTAPINYLPILSRAIDVVLAGYGDSKRKMGPLAVIHPLRVASIIPRLTHDATIMDFLSAFLHDRDEDLTLEKIGIEKYQEMERKMNELSAKLDQNHQWYLGERMLYLTCRDDEEYCMYLTRLLDQSSKMPDLLRVKLADRLDNTFDLGVNELGIQGSGAFATIFNLLFLPNYKGIVAPETYVPLSEDVGVQILANVFKNAEFLSLLVSQRTPVHGSTEILHKNLILASIRISHYIILDTFCYLSPQEQHQAIRDVMQYTQSGGLLHIRQSDSHILDGLFLNLYGVKEGRRERFKQVFSNDKAYLARIGLVFMAIFSCFNTDPEFVINGICSTGIHAVG